MRHTIREPTNLSCQLLIHLHQLRHALALSHVLDGETVSLHHGPVILLVSFAQLRGHGGFIVEISKAGIRVEGAGIEDGLGGLLDLGLLRISGRGPWEVVVNYIFGIAIVAFQPSAHGAHPSHMYVRSQHPKME